MRKVSIDDFAAAVMQELEVYADNVASDVKNGVREVSKECLADIRATAPRKTGAYAKGWTDSERYETATSLRIVIHNKARYRLSHLLEKGYQKRGGGRVEGRPHLAPAEEKARVKLLNDAKLTVTK